MKKPEQKQAQSKSNEIEKAGRQALTERRNATRRLVADALLAALFIVVSGVFSIKLPLIEISVFVSVPLILAAWLFSPADAVAVALVGTFAEQVQYGLAWNAPLWMLPAVLQALFLGFAVRLIPSVGKIRAEKGYPNPAALAAIVLGDLLLTVGNTAVTFLDAYIGHYSVGAFTVALVLQKAANFGIRTVVSCVLAYLLIPYLKKTVDKRN